MQAYRKAVSVKRWIVVAAVVQSLIACSAPTVGSLAPAAPQTVVRAASPVCAGNAPETLDQLEGCMKRETLWRQLAVFQRIADANPGPGGHGNRDTGTPGYKASVDYVAQLVRRAGYSVIIQPYAWKAMKVVGQPALRTPARAYAFERDWFVARNSGAGSVTAPVEPPRSHGCLPADFRRFTRGNIALMQRGTCAYDVQVANAGAAGASAAILYNEAPALDEPSDRSVPEGGAYEARLNDPGSIPVIGVASYAVGADLLRGYRAGGIQASVEVRVHAVSGTDYNLIAQSRYGDPHSVLVVEGHLDSIYGAGMLDNASGSTTILEIALNLAKTPTRNRLRFIWFGGEELGLLGSRYYTQHLTPTQLHRIAFDVDADVTATPNFDILIADARRASNAKHFPPNVVPQSKIGNRFFADYFNAGGIVYRPASFGNDGTDSNSFSLVGVPNTGILTQQDCCKHRWEKRLWGGFLGNYEGKIPSFNGGCVDQPLRWCDNLSNNDPFVLELASRATAYVVFNLANYPFPQR